MSRSLLIINNNSEEAVVLVRLQFCQQQAAGLAVAAPSVQLN
jgi:hypothetical protein